MKFRIVGAGLAAVLTLTSLTACRSNVGVAARVNGETISESQVTTYLSKDGQDPKLIAQAKAQGQGLTAPRVIVLQYELGDRLYERALQRNGGVPSCAALEASRDRAVSLLAGGGQAASDAQMSKQFTQLGIESSFLPTYLRVLESQYALIQRLKLSQRTELNQVVIKAGAKVSVSPRYGAWDAKELQLSGGEAAGLPGFVTLQPQPGAASASPSAAGS